MSQGLAVGVAKVLAIGAVMASGAAGVVALSRDTDAPKEDQAVVEAVTPVPSATVVTTTSTPSATASVLRTPTAVVERLPFIAPSGAMGITAAVWVNAEGLAETVAAFVGDTECATSSAILLHDGPPPTVVVLVPSATTKPDCGTPGAIVRFEIDGQPARQTVMWEAGASLGLTLTVGPDFAIYHGFIKPDALPVSVELEPFVEGKQCGGSWSDFRGLGPLYEFELVVYPDELYPGCGRPGVDVTLVVVHVDDMTGARTKLAEFDTKWAPQPGISVPFSDTPLEISGVSD